MKVLIESVSAANERCRLISNGGIVARLLLNAMRDFFDPTPEEQNVVLANSAMLREAEKLIESCEHCNPDGAEIPFDNLLDRVTGSDPSVADYVLEQPAKCPNCRRDVLEKTLIEPK